jgi:outer membrane protein assembly factor BamB
MLPFQVGGLETASIALVSAIVMKSVERGTPVNGFYIRKSRKRTGLTKYIEGTLTDEPIVLVDDLINSGSTIQKQIKILADRGKKVRDVFVMLAFRDKESYASLGEDISLSYLFTLPDFGIPLRAQNSAEVVRDDYDVVWTYKAPDPSFHIVLQKSAPVTDGKRVYFGCDDGVFRALDISSGTIAWEFSVGKHPRGKGILSSPALHDDRVYFGGYDGTVYALDANSGKKLWSFAEADWIGSSPSVAPDLGLVYIGLEFGFWKKRGGIVALDVEDGSEKWRAEHTGLTHGSPLYIPEESMVVIGSNDGLLYAYNAATGRLLWKFPTRGDIKTRPAYYKKQRAVLLGSMDGVIYALSAIDGSPLYARETGAGIYSIPLVYGDTVYVASLDKCLYAIDCTTWKERFVYETGGRIFASPVMAMGSLWIGSNDGKLYELDPETGKLRSFFQASERITNAIAHQGDTILVPTFANELYAIRRRST